METAGFQGRHPLSLFVCLIFFSTLFRVWMSVTASLVRGREEITQLSPSQGLPENIHRNCFFYVIWASLMHYVCHQTTLIELWLSSKILPMYFGFLRDLGVCCRCVILCIMETNNVVIEPISFFLFSFSFHIQICTGCVGVNILPTGFQIFLFWILAFPPF